MNLSAVGAGSRTVEAFVSVINEEADPAGHCYNSHPRQRASADAFSAKRLRWTSWVTARSAERTAASRLSPSTPTRRTTPPDGRAGRGTPNRCLFSSIPS